MEGNMRHTWLAMMLVVGCDGGGGPLPLEDLPDEFASGVCTVIDECSLSSPTLVFEDEACESFFESVYRNGYIAIYGSAIERGTIEYDAQAARDCIAQYESQGCELLSAGVTVEYAEICARIFRGTVADGGACSLSEECGEDSYCGGEECPGTCMARTPEGSACTDFSQCAVGYYCLSGTCRTLGRGPSGGPCDQGESLDCPTDEVCVGATSETPGTCTSYDQLRTRGEGEECEFSANDGELCREGLSCALVDGVAVCVAPVETGDDCFVGAAPSMCPSGNVCESTAEGSTCVALPLEGERCEDMCVYGLRCLDGVCGAPRDNGEACTDGRDCGSQRCEEGVCAVPDDCSGP
jgi:hypothetical protein